MTKVGHVHSLTDSFTVARQSIQSALGRLDVRGLTIKEKERMTASMRGECDRPSSVLSKLEQQYVTFESALKSEIEAFNSSIPKTKRKLDLDEQDLRHTMTDLEVEHDALRQKRFCLSAQFQEVERRLRELAADVAETESQMTTIEISKDETDFSIKELRLEISESFQTAKQITQKISAVERQLVEHEAAVIQKRSQKWKQKEIAVRLRRQIEAERNVGLEKRNDQLFLLSNAANEEKLIQARLALLRKENAFVRQKLREGRHQCAKD
jgi:chromosome segregation ATPase